MKARLLSTVAASLLIGVGIASAQSPNQQSTPERAPAAQQKAPAEKVSPPMNAREHKGPETTGQASPDSKTDRSGTMNRSSEHDKSSTGTKAPETSGQAPKSADQDKAGAGTKSQSEPKAAPNTQGQRGATENKSDMNRSSTETNKSQNNAQDTRTNQSTTGQGAASGQAKLSTEQRTKITSVIRSEKVERVEPSQLNVAINVGTRIPTSVRVHRLPQEVVTIYPEWRGYDYILVGEKIVIIDPRTHEIVFILEA